MKKVLSIFSLFVGGLVAFTYNNPLAVDHSYTPSVSAAEVTATDASTYNLNYPFYVRQASDDNGTTTYSLTNLIQDESELSTLSNTYFHDEVNGADIESHPLSKHIATKSADAFESGGFEGRTGSYAQFRYIDFYHISPSTSITISGDYYWTNDSGTEWESRHYWRIYIRMFDENYNFIAEEYANSAATFTTPANAAYFKMEFSLHRYSGDGSPKADQRTLTYAISKYNYVYDNDTSYTSTTYTPATISTSNYVEYSYDDIDYTIMSATSDTIEEYYSFTNVTTLGSPISLTEIAFSEETITAVDQEYYMLLTLNNSDGLPFGDIVVDGTLIRHETDIASGYVINDENTEIAIPLTNTLTEDGSITHAIETIEVFDNGTYEIWTINNNHSISVELPIQQTASYVDSYIDKTSVTFGEDYNLIIELDNPDEYYTGTLVINGIEYEENAGYTASPGYYLVTVPLTAQSVYGDNVHHIDSIEFIEQVSPFDSYVINIDKLKYVRSDLTFTNDITVTDIDVPGTSYLGDIIEVNISLDNPEQLPVNFIQMNGDQYSVFESNDTNTLITIELLVGTEEGSFDYLIDYINFSKTFGEDVYNSSKVIDSPFSYTVNNPIDLAGVRVKNFRSAELKATVDSPVDLVVTLDNPNAYEIHSIIINGVSYKDFTHDDNYTVMTIPFIAADEIGDMYISLDGVRFEHFNNIQTFNSFLIDDIAIVLPVQTYEFTKEVEVKSVSLDTENVYVGDKTNLLLTLDNPNNYEITALSINGREYSASEFDMNEDYTSVTIPTSVGNVSSIIFNLDSITFKRFTELGTRIFESITEFVVGSEYEKQIALTNNVWWAVFLYSTLAPRVDWLLMSDAGHIWMLSVFAVILLSFLIYLIARKKKEKINNTKVIKGKRVRK
ncbi:hypothetical protein KHQ82_05370 [Mycoplasmatota bacterium]|nr:hypothetical protein KHQ82_05370 [Mycoplasmatota bacterium]